MANGSFQANDAGIRALLAGPEVGFVTLKVADEAQEIAEGLAADFVVTGDYEKSFHVRSEQIEITTDHGTHKVAGAILENTSDHAAAVEFGNARTPHPHHVLARTIDLMTDG